MDYRQILDDIARDLLSVRKVLCTSNTLSLSPLNGGSVSATLQSSSLTTGDIPEANAIRWLDIESDADTTLEITVVLHDGSTWSHRTFRDPYKVKLPLTASPIKSVTVEELDNNPDEVSINYLSLHS